MAAGRAFAIERERRTNPIAATRCFRFVSRSRGAGHRCGSVALRNDNRCSDGSWRHRGDRGRSRCCRRFVNNLRRCRFFRCHHRCCCRRFVNALRSYGFFHFSRCGCLDCRCFVNDGGFRLGGNLLNLGGFVCGCRLSGDGWLSYVFSFNFNFNGGFSYGLSNDFLRRRLRFAGNNLLSRFWRFGFAGGDVGHYRGDDFSYCRFANALLSDSDWRRGFGNQSLNLRLFLLLVLRTGNRVADPDFT